MVEIKKPEEINILREGGQLLARVIENVSHNVLVGTTTEELDLFTRKLMQASGDEPAFLGYKPRGAKYPYPAALCVSVNDEVVHGIPSKERILREGDIITLDAGLRHKGFVTDMAVTIPVGRVDVVAARLISTARECLRVAIKTARAGSTTGDVGALVEATAKQAGFSTPHELGGHGVGKDVHEEPFVPNFGKPGEGTRLVPGMVLAIEPIVTEGSGELVLESDGYTYKTRDGKRSAQFEHTVLVTDDEPEILTNLS